LPHSLAIIDIFGSTYNFSDELAKNFEKETYRDIKRLIRFPLPKKVNRFLFISLSLIKISRLYLRTFRLAFLCKRGDIFIFNIPGIPIIETYLLTLIRRKKGISVSILHNFKASHGERKWLRNYKYYSFYQNSDIVVFHEKGLDLKLRSLGIDRLNLYCELPSLFVKKTSNINMKYRESNDDASILKLGFIGVISKYKNLEYVVSEIDLLEHHIRKKISLTVAGNPNYSVDHLIKSLHNTELHDLKVNLEYLTDSKFEEFVMNQDFIIIPYVNSSGSGILSYAASLGVPVIANAIPVFENFVHKYKSGAIIDCRSEKALANFIEKNISDYKQKTFYKKSLETMIDHLPSWKDYVVSINNACKETLNDRT